MRKLLLAMFILSIVYGKAFSASYTGTVLNVYYSVNKVNLNNFIQVNVKSSTGVITGFAIPLSGGTYSSSPSTPFTDQEASRFMSILLTAKSTGNPIEIISTRSWSRPSDNYAFLLVDSAELTL